MHVLNCVAIRQLAWLPTSPIYPRRDGQAELTWVAGYIPR